MTITADTLRKIRRIELQTRRLVNNSFAGAYHAVFKGKGIAFDTVRPYQPGDDIRDIDWNVTARTGDPHVKRYIEERELTVMLVFDGSASCLFGTTKQQKRELAAELGAVLAYAAIRNNDRVGLLIFSDKIEKYIPPRKGRNHTLRLIRELLAAQSNGSGTDIATALQTVNRVLTHGAIVFLISDFLAPVEHFTREMMALSRRHDTIAIQITDPRETQWPQVGLVGLQDAESGSVQWIDTHSAQWQTAFTTQTQQHQHTLQKLFSNALIDSIHLPNDGDYVASLTQFFQQRTKRLMK